MADYCNITTDLQRVFSDIEDYKARDVQENWTKTTGQTNVYEKEGTGFVSAVFEDGTMYTLTTSVALVDASASSYYYDDSIDKLYIHTSGSDAPSGYTIETGEDWDALKTAMRDEAQDDVDSYLSRMYQTPLMPRTNQVHHSNDYDSVIIESTALITCAKIVKRVDFTAGQALYDKAINFDDDLPKGFLNQLLDGDRTLRDQVTAKEVGSINIRSFNPSNSTAIEPVFSGIYTGDSYQIWRLQIDTSGAPGTATWKLSDDGGATFSPTLQDTFGSNGGDRRVLIGSGIYAYFPTTYTSGDWWDLELFPLSDNAVGNKIGSITITRR